jgi:hypothetical protein
VGALDASNAQLKGAMQPCWIGTLLSCAEGMGAAAAVKEALGPETLLLTPCMMADAVPMYRQKQRGRKEADQNLDRISAQALHEGRPWVDDMYVLAAL